MGFGGRSGPAVGALLELVLEVDLGVDLDLGLVLELDLGVDLDVERRSGALGREEGSSASKSTRIAFDTLDPRLSTFIAVSSRYLVPVLSRSLCRSRKGSRIRRYDSEE